MEIRICKEQDLKAYYELRMNVFVEEQGVLLTDELDAFDKEAIHAIVIDHQQVVACGRLLQEEDKAHLGRIAVRKEERKKGYGKAICEFLVQLAFKLGYVKVELEAQLTAVGFYQKLGFKAKGSIFMDAGIQHRMMYKIIKEK